MNRREFVTRSLAGAVGSLLVSRWAATGWAATEPPAFATKALFESSDPQLIRLAEEVFNQCVLGKIKPPEGTLKHRWVQAGTGNAFYGQWIWDAMFVVDLLAILPDGTEVVFNDWGVLRIIRQQFPRLELVQGRLLTKLKRGPRIANVLDKLPAGALQHLKSTNLGVPVYQRFLREQNITRVELDNPIQGLDLGGAPPDLKLSLYIPFAYVSTTRFCLVANCDLPEKKGVIGVFPCHQECQKYTFYLNNPVMTTPLTRREYKQPAPSTRTIVWQHIRLS